MSAREGTPPVAELAAAIAEALPRRGARVTDLLSYGHGRASLPAVRLEVVDADGHEHTVRVAEGERYDPVLASLWVRGPALDLAFWTHPLEVSAPAYVEDFADSAERMDGPSSGVSNDHVRRLVAFADATRSVPFRSVGAPGDHLDDLVELARTVELDHPFDYDAVLPVLDTVLSGVPLEWALRRVRTDA